MVSAVKLIHCNLPSTVLFVRFHDLAHKKNCLAPPESGVTVLIKCNTSICQTVFSLELNALMI